MQLRAALQPALLLLCLVSLGQLARGQKASGILKTLTEVTSDGGRRCSQKADIFFAIDSSHSVGKRNFKLVLKFLHEIVDQLLHRSTNFRFGFIVFSDKADMVVKLKDYSMSRKKDRRALLNYIVGDIEYKSGKTATGEAFQLIRELGFAKENGHRSDAKKVIVLLTDGRANGRADPVKEAKKLRNRGTSIVALGIGTGISKNRLQMFSNKRQYVSVVRDFDDLGKVSKVITDTLCDGVVKHKSEPCGEGLKLVGGKCQPIKPTCRKACPKGFSLESPCKCVPILKVGKDCKKSCKESEILVKGCICVPRLSKRPKKKVCKKTCSKDLTLNKKLCKCECKKRCPGSNFEQKSDCSCVCKMRCRRGLALNRATCRCNKVDCKPRFEYFDGKCRPKVRKFCTKGQVLIRDVCMKGECPKGYKMRSDRKCYKYGCDIGYKRTKAGKCVKMCTGKKYYYKKRCHTPKPCGLHEYFRVNSPGCQRTCNEPVLISKCPKDRAPRCVCQPYFLQHKGKCIHPSDCPNIPICIQKADVIFMMDSSLTVTERNFYLIKNFVRDIVQQFYLKSGDRQRVGVMRFNHRANIVLDLDSWEHNSHEEILKKIENIDYEPGLTFLGEALHKVRTKMWNKLAGMRSDVPRVTILLTDGTDTNGQVDPLYEAKQLRQSGSFFVTIAIGDDIGKNRKKFFKLAGPEGRVFVFGLRAFQDLHSMVARVLSFHCEKPLCPHPYLLHGDCIKNYKSITRVEYVPERFTCRKVVKENFKKVRCACPQPKTSSSPCKDMFRTVTTTHFKLNMKKEVCDSNNKDVKVRCACPKSSRKVSDCKNQFRTITVTAFKLVAGGEHGFICKKVEKSKTRRCSCPKPVRKYEKCKNNFKIMHEKTWDFDHESRKCVQHRRTKEIRCSCPKPSVETGHCNGKFVPIKIYTQKVNMRNQCDDIMWTGSARCKRICRKKIDIAFVIDSSDSVRGVNFEYIRRFIIAIAQRLNVSRDEAHIALLKYSSVRNMKVIFNYIAHYSLDSIKARVRQMRYSPGTTYTGDALYNFRHFLLNKINGYRGASGNADSILIMVTDGASNSKIRPEKQAAKIKAMGTKIITVGVGDDIKAKQLDKIASKPAAIHSFKTTTFSELLDSAFVDEVVAATCRVGKVNKVSVKAKFVNKVRDFLARSMEIDWSDWGFKKVNPKDLAQFKMKVKGKYVEVVGASPKAKSKFLSSVRNSIARRLRVHPYSIRKLKISRKMWLTGLIKDTKIPKLKSSVKDKSLKVTSEDKVIKFEDGSFSTTPHITLEVVRQAANSAEIVLGVIRPLRRLMQATKAAIPFIKNRKARKLSNGEVGLMMKISNKADNLSDKLIILSQRARRTRDEKVAKTCIESFKTIMSSATTVSKHAGYIAYFSRKGDRDLMKRRIEKVVNRISAAYAEIGLTETKMAKSKAI